MEFEARFLDIDIAAMTRRLKSIGARRAHGRTLFQRRTYNLCSDATRGFGRVRDEGGRVTMTTKIYVNPKFPDEREVVIAEGFDAGCRFIESLGLRPVAYQQTYRERWKHRLAHEITFDHVPGLPPYMEVDCTSEANLDRLVELLGLGRDQMRFGPFGKVYEHYYGIAEETINKHISSLTFKHIMEEIRPKKNAALLKAVYDTYRFVKVKDMYLVKEFKQPKSALKEPKGPKEPITSKGPKALKGPKAPKEPKTPKEPKASKALKKPKKAPKMPKKELKQPKKEPNRKR